MRACRKCVLVFGPATSVASSAPLKRAMAVSRSFPDAISLAIMRIVMGVMTEPASHAGIDAQALPLRRLEGRDRPCRRQETVAGSSALSRTSMAWPDISISSWPQRQLLARGDAQLPFHEIEPGDGLRDGMLDLQARVHLDEVPRRRRRQRPALDQELDGAGALVGHGLGAGDGSLGDPGAQLRRHARRWGLLDHLLVAPLQRAVALEQMHDVAVASPNTCTSMWRGRSITFSSSTRASPKAAFGLALRRSRARRRSRPRARPGACRARRRRPPP